MFLKNLDFVQKYLRSSSNGSKEYKHDLINQLNEKYIKYIKKAKATGLPYHTIHRSGSIDLLKLYLGASSSGFMGKYSIPIKQNTSSSSAPIPIPKRKKTVRRKLTFN